MSLTLFHRISDVTAVTSSVGGKGLYTYSKKLLSPQGSRIMFPSYLQLLHVWKLEIPLLLDAAY